MKLAANLGFLWTGLPLPDGIRAAARAGFGAVEAHYPYAHPAEDIRTVLSDSGVPMLGINTRLGGDGDFGLAALTGREAEARDAIDEAISYATIISANHVSVIPGLTGGTAGAETTFRENLTYACARAADVNLTIVIEPLSQRAVPGAHLSEVDAALATIESVGASNLKIMLDLFHTQVTEGDLTETVRRALPHIGHIQFASVPDRCEPDTGEIDYTFLLPQIESMGYDGWFGAEYRPRTTTDDGLAWMASFR